MEDLENTPEPRRPNSEAVCSQVIEAFIAAARAALAEMAGTEAIVRTVGQARPLRAPDDVSAVVQLTSATEGYLILEFPQRTAAALARRVFSGVLQEIGEDLICDCVGEIANVVAGQSKALLAGTPYHFRFSVPRIVLGVAPELELSSGRNCLAVSLSTDLGDIAMHLLL